jgi:hypothetical protein
MGSLYLNRAKKVIGKKSVKDLQGEIENQEIADRDHRTLTTPVLLFQALCDDFS